MLAEIDITTALKDPGFIQWLIYGYLCLTLWEKVSGMLQKKKATEVQVVGGEVEVSRKVAFADKAETKKAIEEIKSSIKSLTESLSTQHMAALKAGEDRVRNLGEVLDSETAEIKHAIEGIGTKLEILTAALHEKINVVALKLAAAEANIQNLQAHDFVTQTTKRRSGS